MNLRITGAYQLTEAIGASERLTERGVTNSVVYMIEPGRFRDPRDDREAEHVVSPLVKEQIFPGSGAVRVFLCHMRLESLLGVIR
jgi:hypothetical protein